MDWVCTGVDGHPRTPRCVHMSMACSLLRMLAVLVGHRFLSGQDQQGYQEAHRGDRGGLLAGMLASGHMARGCGVGDP